MPMRLMYPDVLGAIAGDNRLSMNDLQFAVGIFPKQAFINQPVEVVIVLQNMIDQPMQVKIGLQIPSEDRKGNPVVIDTPRGMMALNLGPGEVGVARMPLVALPPTRPGTGLPVRVAVRYRAQGGVRVRPPGGGPPPSVISISPFRLQVMRDVNFVSQKWNDSTDIITITFDLVPKHIPRSPQNMQTSYESLWTAEQMETESRLAHARIEDARSLVMDMGQGSSYWAFMDAVHERFARRGMPLHPGEVRAIAKMMAYTTDEAHELEKNVDIEKTRFFQALCQVLAHDEKMLETPRGEIYARYMFEDVLFDATGFAFRIVQPRVSENLGDMTERINYANRLLVWLAGFGEPDLNYVYLPLVMGGLLVNRIVTLDKRETPWLMVEQLREAYQGRIRLVSGETIVVFEMLGQLLDEVEAMMIKQRVRRE